MYGIIASGEYIEDIRQAVQGSSILFEESGEFTSDVFMLHCQSSANANVQTLIIDMTCTDDAAIIRGVQQFRLLRDSRIIIIAPGRVPGDSTITTLIGLQILDIVAPLVDEDSEDDDERPSIAPMIKTQLASKPSYGNVVRWDVKTDESAKLKELEALKKNLAKEKGKGVDRGSIDRGPDQSLLDHIHSLEIIEPPPPRIKEKIVYRDQIIGTMIIAVGGAYRRSGSTYSAMRVATFLSRLGEKVACVELVDPLLSPPAFYALPKDKEIKDFHGAFSYQNIDFFPEMDIEKLTLLRTFDYRYFVLDMGLLKDDHHSHINQYEFTRSNYNIMTSTICFWDFDRLTRFVQLDFNHLRNQSLNVIVNLANKKSFDVFKEALTQKVGKVVDLNFTLNEFEPDPFLLDEGTISDYQKMLSSVLSSYKNKKRGFPFFRK